MDCVEGVGLSTQVHRRTLAELLFTSLLYAVKILCEFKWRKLLIVNQ